MVEWITSDTTVDYDQAVAWMEARVAGIRAGTADEAIWLVEHPPIFTAGTSAKLGDLTDPGPFSRLRGSARRAIHLSRGRVSGSLM